MRYRPRYLNFTLKKALSYADFNILRQLLVILWHNIRGKSCSLKQLYKQHSPLKVSICLYAIAAVFQSYIITWYGIWSVQSQLRGRARKTSFVTTRPYRWEITSYAVGEYRNIKVTWQKYGGIVCLLWRNEK